jgi:NitT/TauT family transport system substrate-binding protein
MHRREFINGLAGTTMVAAGCVRKQGSGGNKRIRVAVSPYIASAPFYLAYERGYFDRLGLRVEVHVIPSPSQAIPLLAGDQMEVALFSISPAHVNAVARGAQMRIVAAREIASPDCGTFTLCARRDLFPNGAADMKRLQGKRVAIYSRANTAEYILDLILATSGLSSGSVAAVPLPTSEAVSALLAGKVDAVLTDFIAAGRAAAAADIVTVARLGTLLPGFQFSYMLFGSVLLQGDPGVGSRFLRAYLRGNRDFMDGKTPRFLTKLARDGGVDPALVRSTCRGAFAPDGKVNLRDLQRFIDWAVYRKYCPQRIEAAQMVDNRFLALARNDDES